MSAATPGGEETVSGPVASAATVAEVRAQARALALEAMRLLSELVFDEDDGLLTATEEAYFHAHDAAVMLEPPEPEPPRLRVVAGARSD